MTASPGPSTAFVTLHLLGSSFGWATSFVFMKLAGNDVAPIVVAACRATVAMLALVLIFGVIGGRNMLPRREDWGRWLVIGTLNGWAPNLMTAYALTLIPAGLAAMIQAAGPLVVALLAHVMFASERLDGRRALGVLAGLIGMALLIGPAAIPGGPVDPFGALAMAGTMLSYALCTLYIRSLPAAEPDRLAFGQQSVSGLAAIPMALFWVGPMGFLPALDHVWNLLALGVIATAVPVTLFMRVLRAAGPTRASMNSYLMPLWATMLAVFVLGESIGLREIIGGIVVLGGVALVTAPRRQTPA